MNVTTRFAGGENSLLVGFLLFFGLDDFASLVETAGGADGVRKALVAAVGTDDGVHCRQGIL